MKLREVGFDTVESFFEKTSGLAFEAFVVCLVGDNGFCFLDGDVVILGVYPVDFKDTYGFAEGVCSILDSLSKFRVVPSIGRSRNLYSYGVVCIFLNYSGG